MRSRCGRAMVLATGLLAGVSLLGVVGCGGRAPVFRPAGASSGVRAPASGSLSSPADTDVAPGLAVDFESPQPSGALRRAIVAGYQAYARSLWAAVGTGGHDADYLRAGGADAQAYVRRQVAWYARSGRPLTGVIRYFATTVTGVYFGHGAAVASCVQAPGRRYLEEVAEGRRADGTWFVTHVDTYPASSSQGAMCA